MKISNEQLRAIQEQSVQRPKVQQGDFTDLLARHLDAGAQLPAAAPEGSSLPIGGMTAPVGGMLEDSASTIGSPLFAEAATHMEGMFDTFDRYSSQLAANDPGSLKEAYSLLQDMNGRIAEFKERYPEAASQQPELASMLNELDVLATTETFKFNRGDYA